MILAYAIISPSEPIFVAPIEEMPDVPSAPDMPTLILQEIESITISWKEPDYHRSLITSYEVQYSLADTENFTTHLPGPAVQRVYEITGLQPAVTYLFRVRGINALGPGNFSDPASYNTLNATAPGEPSQPRVTATTTNSISLSWEEVIV
jgi:hypothetical protein